MFFFGNLSSNINWIEWKTVAQNKALVMKMEIRNLEKRIPERSTGDENENEYGSIK